jgi:hypothetical protein
LGAPFVAGVATGEAAFCVMAVIVATAETVAVVDVGTADEQALNTKVALIKQPNTNRLVFMILAPESKLLRQARWPHCFRA